VPVRDRITDLLDLAGLVAVAAGAGTLLYGWILTATESRGMTAAAAGAGMVLSGLVLLGGSWLAGRSGR
jgi:hypothetical protein